MYFYQRHHRVSRFQMSPNFLRNPHVERQRTRIHELEEENASLASMWWTDHTRLRELSRDANDRLNAQAHRIRDLEGENERVARMYDADHIRLREVSRDTSSRLALRNRQLQDVRYDNGVLRVDNWKLRQEIEVRY